MPDTTYVGTSDISGLLGPFTIPAAWSAGSPSPLTTAITRVRQTIDAFCCTTFIPVARQFLLSGKGREHAMLTPVTRYPINTITAVYLRGSLQEEFVAAGQLVENVDFIIHNSRRALTKTSAARGSFATGADYNRDPFEFADIPTVWPCGTRNIKVVGTFGRNGIPENVKKAAVLLIREEIQPGYIATYMDEYYQESFADGYSKSKTPRGSASAQIKIGATLGYPAVDVLLGPFRNALPTFGVTG